MNQNKNIVICSDGTGNRGGVGYDTNVWRIFNGVELNSDKKKQVVHYDDGVGTEDFKYFKILGGAFGWGLTRNIVQAYKFLCRNYQENDDIYFFGFSRGAYTVRAMAAFVLSVGIIRDANQYSDSDLEKLVYRLIKIYKHRTYEDASPDNGKTEQGSSRLLQINFKDICDDFKVEYSSLITDIEIKCIGVWDTVSAVGLPFNIGLKWFIEKCFFKFRFRDHVLSERVIKAYHAISIDDQRKTFHPEVWEEREDIEQVFFSGVHSNVGGGYPKQGLAYVSLEWMLSKIKSDNGNDGIILRDGFEKEVNEKAKIHDKLYNSRSGPAVFYRYKPRFFDAIKPLSIVKVHYSCLERIVRQTQNYNPGNFTISDGQSVAIDEPERFESPELISNADDAFREVSDSLLEAKPTVRKLENIYLTFVLMTLSLVCAITSAALPLWFGVAESDLTENIISKYAVYPGIVFSLVCLVIIGYASFVKKLISLMFVGIYWGFVFLLPIISVEVIWGVSGLVWILDAILTPLTTLLPEKMDMGLHFYFEHQKSIVAIMFAAFVVLVLLYRQTREKAKEQFFQAWNQWRTGESLPTE